MQCIVGTYPFENPHGAGFWVTFSTLVLQLILMIQREPTAIFILGGGGDLAQRKLLPALFDLYAHSLMPQDFIIVGLARTQRTDDEYRSLVRDAIVRQNKKIDTSKLATFCTYLQYVSGSFEEEGSYKMLESSLADFESNTKKDAHRLFYLAVPPAHYEHIFTLLSKSSISQPSQESTWTRFLIEKPFGHDYHSALALDKALGELFVEDQIYRIDHYLAKEAVQNILSFRFANTLFQDIWSSSHIEAVYITLHESINASTRGAFYDTVGALRDVGQNHLLQLLALIAMDKPISFDAASIRENRASILQKLVPITAETLQESVIRAQYEGYTETAGVAKDSLTETYFELKAYVADERWHGVPFFLAAGKALRNNEVVIRIVLKKTAFEPFKPQGNVITLTVSPVQSMNITLNVKKPGHAYALEENTLSFAWDEENRGVENAYEKVLLDCIDGEKTLFTQTNEVLSSWKFISSVMEHWSTLPLQTYQEGSEGPSVSLLRHKEIV